MLKLTITEMVANPNFAAQLEEYNRRSQSYNAISVPYPDAEVQGRHLEVSVTQEQFEAIRKAVLEKF